MDQLDSMQTKDTMSLRFYNLVNTAFLQIYFPTEHKFTFDHIDYTRITT